MKSRVSHILTVGLVLSVGLTPASAEGSNGSLLVPREIGKQAIYMLGACQTEIERDCIESFGVLEVVDGVETFIAGEQTAYDAVSESEDEKGNKVYGGSSTWKISSSSGVEEIELWSKLESTRHIVDVPTKIRGASFFIAIRNSSEDLTTKFQVKLRTSWFKPENFTLAAGDAGFSEAKIPGGTLWTLSGTRVKVASYDYTSPEEVAEKFEKGAVADYESTMLHFIGHHVAIKNQPRTSYFSDPCSHTGYMVQANNAAGGGMAYWDDGSKSLNFSIQAAHRTKDGKLNRGFYRMWVNKDYIKCRWPQSGLDKAAYFKVGVYNEDGSKQVATTVVSTKRDLLTVSALNFHYSAPTIKLQASKKRQFVCVNKSDKTDVKRLKNKKSKCPDGFIKNG